MIQNEFKDLFDEAQGYLEVEIAGMNQKDTTRLFNKYQGIFKTEKGSGKTIPAASRQMIITQAVNAVHEASNANYEKIFEGFLEPVKNSIDDDVASLLNLRF